MIKIGLLSDTHGFLDPDIFTYFNECNEIWHAGDIGDIKLAGELQKFKPFKAVYGNIDGKMIRRIFGKDLLFELGGLKVFITHIGGYPGRYLSRVEQILDEEKPNLYICGHSHILKIMPDKQRGLLHMNPGASGREGFHKVRTLIRFQINNAKIDQVEVIELGPRYGTRS